MTLFLFDSNATGPRRGDYSMTTMTRTRDAGVEGYMRANSTNSDSVGFQVRMLTDQLLIHQPSGSTKATFLTSKRRIGVIPSSQLRECGYHKAYRCEFLPAFP